MYLVISGFHFLVYWKNDICLKTLYIGNVSGIINHWGVDKKRDLRMPHDWPGQPRDIISCVWVLPMVFWALWEILLLHTARSKKSNVSMRWAKENSLVGVGALIFGGVRFCFCVLAHAGPYASCPYTLPHLIQALKNQFICPFLRDAFPDQPR